LILPAERHYVNRQSQMVPAEIRLEAGGRVTYHNLSGMKGLYSGLQLNENRAGK